MNRSLKTNGHLSDADLIALTDGCTKYCFLKYLASLSPIDPRLAMQMKCIEKFKYDKGRELDRNISEHALEMWVHEGHAARFSTVFREKYHPGIDPQIIYDLTMARTPVSTPAQT